MTLRWQRAEEGDDKPSTRKLEVRSFLDYLFADVTDILTTSVGGGNTAQTGGYQDSHSSGGGLQFDRALHPVKAFMPYETVPSAAAAPSMNYAVALKRETQKPFHLNYTPSTDQCVLPTRTAPPAVYDFRELKPARQVALDDMNGTFTENTQHTSGGGHSSDLSGINALLDKRWAKERDDKEFQEAHLNALRDAIKYGKLEARRYAYRPPS